MRLIDADALTEEIRHAIKESESPWTHYGWVQKIVDDAQTVDPVKHGCWEKRCLRAFSYPMYDYRCSECLTYNDYDTTYCPNCGAKMDET